MTLIRVWDEALGHGPRNTQRSIDSFILPCLKWKTIVPTNYFEQKCKGRVAESVYERY